MEFKHFHTAEDQQTLGNVHKVRPLSWGGGALRKENTPYCRTFIENVRTEGGGGPKVVK